MKQKCDIQIGLTQYGNASMPLGSRYTYLNHTLALLEKAYNFVLAQGGQKLQWLAEKLVVLLSEIRK